jgi:hypothetical protein
VCISINTNEQPTSSPLCNTKFKIKNVTCNQRCESGSLNPDPGFYDQKFKKDIAGNFLNIYFESKTAIGLLKVRSNYRRSIQPSKENIKHFKN